MEHRGEASAPWRFRWPPWSALPALVLVAGGAAAYVMHVAARHTIAVVHARHLLPRWDLATHLGSGWLDYHLLVTAQLHRLLWDLWHQGYWPPGLSIFQMPFYLLLGGGMTSGLWSSPVAFVLIGVIGAAVLCRQWRGAAFLPVAVFVVLLISSPFLLAYATVTMTEMLGALGQLVVLLCYLRYRESPNSRTARAFAVSLTVLLFIKYNYFVLLAGPLVLYEWWERTAGSRTAARLTSLSRWTRHVLSSPLAGFVAVYIVAVMIVMSTGGFEVHLLGARISVRSIGNSGHLVLYFVLARLWYLQRRGRIDWIRLTSADPRVRPLLLWFVVPLTIWLASPYPNHIKDVVNLVINRPVGEPTVGAGIATYLNALRTAYFYSEWMLALVIAAFTVAAVRYREQPPLTQWLILAVPLQFAAIALHQTRFPRFLLLTVVLLCLVAASEVGRWFASSSRRRLVASVLSPLVLASGMIAAQQVVNEDRFRTIAFEHYTDSPALPGALAVIRGELHADDRLLIIGQSDELSPALFRWALGPPSGVPCFPFEVGGAGRLDPAHATRVLLIVPVDTDFAPVGVANFDPARIRAVRDEIDRGSLALIHDLPLPDMAVALRLYRRTSPPLHAAPCR
jgi:hypothetical protein